MAEAIRVNFARPIPVFPLPDAVLLPHAIQPLHIFEPRYRQMVNDCLDGTGQLALACFAGRRPHDAGVCDTTSPQDAGVRDTTSPQDAGVCCDGGKPEHQCPPTLRPAVCVGQIVQHEALPDGRHAILLQGLCRARIVEMIEPDNGRRYRLAKLAPLEPLNRQPPPMAEIRQELRELLNGPRLKSRLRSVDTVMEWFDRQDVSTHALLELIGFALLKDSELKYRLLAEANPLRRAGMIKTELCNLDRLVGRADRQHYRSWPKGLSWN